MHYSSLIYYFATWGLITVLAIIRQESVLCSSNATHYKTAFEEYVYTVSIDSFLINSLLA